MRSPLAARHPGASPTRLGPSDSLEWAAELPGDGGTGAPGGSGRTGETSESSGPVSGEGSV